MRATFFGIVAFLAVLAAADRLLNHGRYTHQVVRYLAQNLS